MSDIVIGGPGIEPPVGRPQGPAELPGRDRRRSALSITAAAALHAAAILVLTLIAVLNPEPPPSMPAIINLQLSSSLARSEQPASAPAGTPAASPAAAPASAAAAAAPVSAPKSGGTQKAVSSGSDFVIPTPKTQPTTGTTTTTTGPGFRQAGGTTGGGASLPAAQSTVPGATLPAAQSGSASGTGAGSTQHAGQGVTVADPSAGTAKGSLDLSGLDKALPGASGAATGTASSTGGGSASGGSGGSGGGGSTGGTGSAGASGTGTGGSDYSVIWDQPDASKGRTLMRAGKPTIPAWVGKQGLDLSLSVSFTLGADGLLSGVTVDYSSGYPDVDTAVIQAIRRWSFTQAKGASPVKGQISYKIASN